MDWKLLLAAGAIRFSGIRCYLIAVLFAFSFTGSVAAEDAPELIAQWLMPSYAVFPNSVAIDAASGNIYVTDRNGFKVFKFDSHGQYITEWHAVCPLGISVDSAGYVYVGDQCGHTVHKFTPLGVESGSWSSFNPWQVFVDHNDYVYVSNFHGLEVYKYDTNGNLLSTIGTGVLSNPGYMAVDKFDNLYLADNLMRVVRFDADGNYVDEWQGVNGPFASPTGIAVDSAGDVYVAELWANRIQKFDNDGNFIVSWGGIGTFHHPRGLALDNAENLYVVDSESHRVMIYASPVTILACVGFEPPLASGIVKVKGNRALPFKAQLFNADGFLMTDLNVVSPPVIQVWYEYETSVADDVSDEALPSGQSTEGNQFFFDSDGRWHYNLKTNNYSAAGTYTVFMDSGDDTEYIVDPTCVGKFVIE